MSLPGVDPYVGLGLVVVTVSLLLLWVFGRVDLDDDPEELDEP